MLMMRLRASSVVFGGAVSLATLVLLYQVLSLPPDNHQQPPGDYKDLASLEARLRRLETDIQTNQHTISEIKSLVRQLARSSSRANSLLGPQYGIVAANRFIRNGLTGVNDAVAAVAAPGSPNKSATMAVAPMAVRYNLTQAAVMPDDCIFAQTAAPPADVQLDKVYAMLKFDNPDGGAWKQGWEIEYDAAQWSSSKKLRVFVVPHSHNDPGWVKTFDQYYTDQTHHILDNMVQKLPMDPRRKFIWAEISFFSLWWDQQSENVREAVRRLVDRGQLEMVTGGWVMNDEANTHYFAMLVQMMEGHEWLKLNLGVKPNNGWAIDPFGMTSTMAYLLKRMGLENMVVQRVHYAVKKYLAREKCLEFRWRQVWDSGSSTEMLCHMMPFYSYDVPHTCGPDPKICCQFDFRRLPGSGVTCPWHLPPQTISDHNLAARSLLLLDQYRKKSQLFRTNVVLVPLGDDFRFVRPEEWDDQFNNYQRLFDYLNTNDDLHVEAQFGTLADYFRAVHEESESLSGGAGSGGEDDIFPSLTGDFFTYADRDDHYWSGYYTTRPFHKTLTRVLEGYLRGAEVLYTAMVATQSTMGTTGSSDGTMVEVAEALMAMLVSSRRSLALFQHHDGITGTAKDHVVVDYANKLVRSITDCQLVIQQAAHYLLAIDQHNYRGKTDTLYYQLGEKYTQHNQLPSKMVLVLQPGTSAQLVIYNPDAHRRPQLLTVRVSSPYVEVIDRKDQTVPCQVDPVFVQSSEASNDMFDVTFLVDLPSLSLTTYTIKIVDPEKVNQQFVSYGKVVSRGMVAPSVPAVFTAIEETNGQSFTLHNDHLQARFGSNGLMQSLTAQGRTLDLNLEFVKYGVKNHRETAGAYLFLPDKEATPLPVGQPAVLTVLGPLLSTVTTHLKNIIHTVTVKSSPGVDGMGVEINNLVNIKLERNYEFAMRLNTDIKNGDVFYTDLNGFQVNKRTRYDKLPIQANYYPIPSLAYIQDDDTRLSLLSAQPLGGSSLASGQLEVMLDRRLMQDDNRGLGQGILDNVLTSSTFRVLLEPRITVKEREDGKLLKNSSLPSLLSLSALNTLLYPEYTLLPTTKVEGARSWWEVGGALPCDVHLVHLRTMVDPPRARVGQLVAHPPAHLSSLTLHRLGFDCYFQSPGLTCSTTAGKVRLSQVFPTMFGEQVQQMSLSMLYEGVDMTKSYTLSLQPMELYTFRLSHT
ncbi:alpha-mannosidase 2x-like isoform X2 [Cherax quadricarinatus]